MARYHINLEGNPGRCNAREGKCPFGTEEEHYGSKREARAAYERASFVPPTAQEYVLSNYHSTARQGAMNLARAIDERDPNFLAHGDSTDFVRALGMANHLDPEAQGFIDAGAREWLQKRTDAMLRDGSEEDRYDAAKAGNEVQATYSYDIGQRRIKDEKGIMAFVTRSADNHIAFARAVSTISMRFDAGLLHDHAGYGKLKYDFSNFLDEELVDVASVTPSAATEWARRQGNGGEPWEQKRLYETLTEGVGSYPTDLQGQRRAAIEAVLQVNGPLTNDPAVRGIYLDASRKLDTEQGLDRKTFAHLLSRFLSHGEVSVKGERDYVQKLIRNTRGDV